MTTDPATLAETVRDLEVRLAYQDHTVAQLDGVVRALFDRLEAVEAEPHPERTDPSSSYRRSQRKKRS